MVLAGAACGCSSDDGPGSTIGQTKGGGGNGGGGQAGTLSFTEFPAGAGSGGGGAGGVGGASGGSAGSLNFGGSSLGGGTSQAGATSGTAGSQSGGVCMRATGSDGDCLDFYPADGEDAAKPQAYSCPDRSAYSTLNGAHAGKCASVTFVTGANTGACCPP
jgi:hypothetical protein